MHPKIMTIIRFRGGGEDTFC